MFSRLPNVRPLRPRSLEQVDLMFEEGISARHSRKWGVMNRQTMLREGAHGEMVGASMDRDGPGDGRDGKDGAGSIMMMDDLKA